MERKINIEAAKRLAEKYASITLEELEDSWFDFATGLSIMHEITGFGDEADCCLCQEAELLNIGYNKCNHCIYCDGYNTLQCVNSSSYKAISKATCPEDLLKALKDRSEYITGLIKTRSGN